MRRKEHHRFFILFQNDGSPLGRVRTGLRASWCGQWIPDVSETGLIAGSGDKPCSSFGTFGT